MTQEMKDKAMSKEIPSTPKGMNLELLGELFQMLGGAVQYGYDPELDFHRKGTAVLPTYQKRRFGTTLTKAVCATSPSFRFSGRSRECRRYFGTSDVKDVESRRLFSFRSHGLSR